MEDEPSKPGRRSKIPFKYVLQATLVFWACYLPLLMFMFLVYQPYQTWYHFMVSGGSGFIAGQVAQQYYRNKVANRPYKKRSSDRWWK